MTPNHDEPESGATQCASCGARFRCGALAGDGGCWCQALPALPPLPGLEGCLCPACLKARVDAVSTPASSGKTGA
ncbi:MAG: hypothetical protein E6R11_04070 [Rhodocyclaceae bacterium]|nr:MAG: hypothetical protein E6R11_04070 [Rhodocyclaceae bacterium]